MHIRELKELIAQLPDETSVFIDCIRGEIGPIPLMHVTFNSHSIVLCDYLVTREPKKTVRGFDGQDYEVPWT